MEQLLTNTRILQNSRACFISPQGYAQNWVRKTIPGQLLSIPAKLVRVTRVVKNEALCLGLVLGSQVPKGRHISFSYILQEPRDFNAKERSSFTLVL